MAGQKERIDVLLAESFKELACGQPIEKITIKAITDKAGVIRPTFYNHFQDKYELLEWIIRTQILEPTRPLIHAGMVDEALMLIFTSIKADSGFYSRAVKLEGQNSFEEIAKRCIEDILQAFLADTGVYCEILRPVHVFCCGILDKERNDSGTPGDHRYLQLYDYTIHDRGD